MPFVPSSLLWVPGAREIFGTDSLVLHNRTRLESYLGFCLPSLKLTCSMLPAPPSPSTTSTLFMNWGRSFGMRFLESTIKAVNMRVGAIGHANSWVIHVTPMFYLTVLFLEQRWRTESLFKEMEGYQLHLYSVWRELEMWKCLVYRWCTRCEHCGHMYDLFLLFCLLGLIFSSSKILFKKRRFWSTWAAFRWLENRLRESRLYPNIHMVCCDGFWSSIANRRGSRLK